MNDELRKNIRHTLWFCAIPKKGGECQHLSYDEGAEEVIDKIMDLVAAHDTAIRIDELEDIDQSRNIEIDYDGSIWCTYCHMMLESKSDECACNTIYQKRKDRLAELRGKGEEK